MNHRLFLALIVSIGASNLFTLPTSKIITRYLSKEPKIHRFVLDESLSTSVWFIQDTEGRWARTASAVLQPEIYKNARSVYVSVMPGELKAFKLTKDKGLVGKQSSLDLQSVPELRLTWVKGIFIGTASNGFYLTSSNSIP